MLCLLHARASPKCCLSTRQHPLAGIIPGEYNLSVTHKQATSYSSSLTFSASRKCPISPTAEGPEAPKRTRGGEWWVVLDRGAFLFISALLQSRMADARTLLVNVTLSQAYKFSLSSLNHAVHAGTQSIGRVSLVLLHILDAYVSLFLKMRALP